MKVEMVVEQYLTVQELAEMLRKHSQTIRKDIREGNLKAVRLGGRNSLRIPMSEATRYIARLEEQAEEN